MPQILFHHSRPNVQPTQGAQPVALRVERAGGTPSTPDAALACAPPAPAPAISAQEDGVWLNSAELNAFYEATDEKEITYPGMGLRVEIVTSGEVFAEFSLSILDVGYRRRV